MKDMSIVKLREIVEWCIEHETVTEDLENKGIDLEELLEELCREMNIKLVGSSYEIIDKLTYNNSDNAVIGIVLGKSVYSDTPCPFATWQQNSRGYDLGHYFEKYEDAVQDFKERSALLLNIDIAEKEDIALNEVDELEMDI